jgi:hypothetical protein
MMDDYVARTADIQPSSYLTSHSVKNCRLSAGETLHIRTKTPVRPTGGSNTGAVSNGKNFGQGKNGRKKLAREMRARRNAR